ncbi:MAG: hypothetical protein ACXVYM_00295 [Gaiellaceae bacterium]
MDAPVRVTTRALGLIVVLAAAWGGIVPFVGPIFDFVVRGTTSSWVWNQHHATLSFAPGLAGVIAGLLMLGGGRALQSLGSLLAMVAGAWFAIGPSLEPIWASSAAGSVTGASGGPGMRALEAIGYAYATGAFIVVLAGLTAGMLAAPRTVAAAPAAPAAPPPAEDEPVTAEQPTVERTTVTTAAAAAPRRRFSFRRPTHA